MEIMKAVLNYIITQCIIKFTPVPQLKSDFTKLLTNFVKQEIDSEMNFGGCCKLNDSEVIEHLLFFNSCHAHINGVMRNV